MTSSEAGRSGGDERTLAGVTLDDRYVVSSTLGAGGMATVYLATDTRLDRSVVVKMPHTALAAQPDFLARFQREIASLTKIEHPHVVKVHDTGTFGGLPYAVLQHLSGGSLRDRLDKAGGKLAPAEILPWLLQVADALDHIHARGMVHRDVKPGNILYDDAGNVVLADFGIAKAMGHLDTGITTTGVTPGSPGYMAPEVIKGGELGPGYDQFSLAVCVYEALAGRLPHEGRTPLELLTNLIHHSAADLAPLAPGIPPDAVSAVMKALSRDPAKRFATCTEFAKSFQQALGVPTMQVFPREFATAMRRRRWLRASVAAAVIAGAAGVGAFVARRGGAERTETANAPPVAESPPAKRDVGETPWKLVTPEGAPPQIRVSQRQIDEAKKLGVPVWFENPRGMRFVLIPAGKFVMGSPPSETGRDADEPQHEATISSAFFLQATEVTNAQFRRFRADHQVRAWSGARVDMDELPVGDVTLDDVAAFAKWAGADGRSYRLPTDEEWELACRAGTTTAAYWGDRVEDAGRFANVCDLSAKSRWSDWRVANTTDGFPAAAAPASFPPNPWGLHDMIGNASELVRADAGRCVTRGGNWASDPARFRCAARDSGTAADAQQPPFGFRLVAELPSPAKRDLGETPWKLVRPDGAPEGVLVSQTQIDEAKRLGVPVWFENSIGMRFVLIPAGKFVMGSPPEEPGRDPGELPAREAEVARAFYLATTELTNAHYRTWNRDHHSIEWDGYKDDSDAVPATSVRILDAESFATWLGLSDGRLYRLPTEVEWEYACRAGTTMPRFWEGDVREARRFANVGDLSARRRWPKWTTLDVDDGFEGLAPPGSFLANPWGLFDVLGNALEWVRSSDATDPPNSFVFRGGSFDAKPSGVRCAFRGSPIVDATVSHSFGGVRLLAELPYGPDIAVPTQGATVEEGLVTVCGTASAAKTVRVNGVTGDVKDGKFDAAITLPPGEQEIEVVAGTLSAIRKVKVAAVPRPDAGWPGVPAWAKVSKQQVDEAKRLGVDVAFENSIGMRFVLIPAGRFWMGSPDDEPGHTMYEALHPVTLTKAHYVAVTETTNAQVRRWKPSRHSTATGVDLDRDEQPAVFSFVTDGETFAEWLTSRNDGHVYRLPTDAEWEYACRAGTRGPFWWGTDEFAMKRFANVADRAAQRIFPRWTVYDFDDGAEVSASVASYGANPWGVFDALGNVGEWTSDEPGMLAPGAAVDPWVRATGADRVLRGGAWLTAPHLARAGVRFTEVPDDQRAAQGIRLVADLPSR